jgi:hypothetical protein
MDTQSHDDIIHLLKQQIEIESVNYINALKAEANFWELKEIRVRIKELKSMIEILESTDKKST